MPSPEKPGRIITQRAHRWRINTLIALLLLLWAAFGGLPHQANAQVPNSVPWKLLSGDEVAGVDYKLQVNDVCKLNGYSFYALRNRYNSEVQVYFIIHGTDCDGKPSTSSVSHTLDPKEVMNDISTWFHVSGNVRIEIKKVQVKYLEEKRKFDELIAKGKEYMSRDQFDYAIEEFENARQYATPQTSHLINDNINDAKSRKVKKIVDDLTKEADKAFDEKDWESAKSKYEEILDIEPDHYSSKHRIRMCEENIEKEKDEKGKDEEDKEDGDEDEDEDEDEKEEKKSEAPRAKSAEELRMERLSEYNKRSDEMHTQRQQESAELSRITTEAVNNIARDFSTVISSGLETNTAENFWSDNSLHVGFSLGLNTGIIPMRVEFRDYTERYDGNNYTILTDERSYAYRTPASMGVEMGVQFHPYMGDYFGIGGYMDINAGIGVGVMAGSRTVSLIGTTTTHFQRMFYYGLRYGAEVWGSPIEWLRPILVYEEEIIARSFNEETFTSTSNGTAYSTRSIQSYTSNLLARNPHWGGGFRCLYLDGEVTFDVMYLRSEMLDYKWGNPKLSFYRNQLIPATHKIRLGLWWQSHLRFDFTFGWSQLPVSNTPLAESPNPTKWNERFSFELRLRYTKNWFYSH